MRHVGVETQSRINKVKAMVQTELSNTERHTPVNSDQTKICQVKVNTPLKELHKSNMITAVELKGKAA